MGVSKLSANYSFNSSYPMMGVWREESWQGEYHFEGSEYGPLDGGEIAANDVEAVLTFLCSCDLCWTLELPYQTLEKV